MAITKEQLAAIITNKLFFQSLQEEPLQFFSTTSQYTQEGELYAQFFLLLDDQVRSIHPGTAQEEIKRLLTEHKEYLEEELTKSRNNETTLPLEETLFQDTLIASFISGAKYLDVKKEQQQRTPEVLDSTTREGLHRKKSKGCIIA